MLLFHCCGHWCPNDRTNTYFWRSQCKDFLPLLAVFTKKDLLNITIQNKEWKYPLPSWHSAAVSLPRNPDLVFQVNPQFAVWSSQANNSSLTQWLFIWVECMEVIWCPNAAPSSLSRLFIRFLIIYVQTADGSSPTALLHWLSSIPPFLAQTDQYYLWTETDIVVAQSNAYPVSVLALTTHTKCLSPSEEFTDKTQIFHEAASDIKDESEGQESERIVKNRRWWVRRCTQDQTREQAD